MTKQPISQDLDAQAQELTLDQLADVSAGASAHVGGMNVLMGDGSVRGVRSGDLAVWQSNYGAGG